MRQEYPSDITRKEFELIREELEGAKKKTHPRKYDLWTIVNKVDKQKNKIYRKFTSA